MEIRSVDFGDAAPLVAALGDELVARYGEDDETWGEGVGPEQFLLPYGVFLVINEDGRDVGCGGVRQLDDGIGEIKRMYVVPEARGRGLSRVLLRALVEHAVALGYGEVWLETGTEQPEAMALYESAGFAPIAPYGQYKAYPNSRCYRLVLTAGPSAPTRSG